MNNIKVIFAKESRYPLEVCASKTNSDHKNDSIMSHEVPNHETCEDCLDVMVSFEMMLAYIGKIQSYADNNSLKTKEMP